MYLHKRVHALLSFYKDISRFYAQNFMSSAVIKQMIHLIFFHNPLFIHKMQFLSSKTAWSASCCNCRASKIVLMTSYWQVHCDHILAKKLPSDKYSLDCKNVSFCIELYTFIRLGIVNSFLFLIFPHCYFYDATVYIYSSDNCAAYGHRKVRVLERATPTVTRDIRL